MKFQRTHLRLMSGLQWLQYVLFILVSAKWAPNKGSTVDMDQSGETA